MSKHENVYQILKGELVLFALPSTQSSLEHGHYVEHRPQPRFPERKGFATIRAGRRRTGQIPYLQRRQILYGLVHCPIVFFTGTPVL